MEALLDRPDCSMKSVFGADGLAECFGPRAVAVVGEELVEVLHQSGGGESAARQWAGAGAEGVDAFGPEALVAENRADQGRASGAQTGGGGAGSAVVDDGRCTGE